MDLQDSTAQPHSAGPVSRPPLHRELRFTELGAVLSALGAGLGGVTVTARMMFAFGRDGLAWRRLSAVSAVTGVPRRALAAEMLIGLVLLTAFRLAGTSALNVFFYLATTGTLALLVVYVLTNVAAAWHLGPDPGGSWFSAKAADRLERAAAG